MNVTEANNLAARKARDYFPVALNSFYEVLKALAVLGKVGIGTGLTGVLWEEEGRWPRCI